VSEILQQWAAERGYHVAWGSRLLIADVRSEIVRRRTNLEIDEQLYVHELESILSGGNDRPEKTIILIAKPCSAHRVSFDVDGKRFDTVIPPTYFRYRSLFEEIRLDLAANGLKGVHLEHLSAPLKALASKLGLVSYGRNNIGYVKGLGSYFQLCGYLTDAVLPEMEKTETGIGMVMTECDNCSVCVGMCPTGAITEDRMLLHAERCLTYVNENPGDWPDWVESRAHNSLVGCLECQRWCPANPELPVEDTGLSFSAAETRLLLSGKAEADDRAESGIRLKLAWLGQPYIEHVLGRNLKALVKSRNI
jgi:epoxyqueuosine reductase